MPQMKSTAGKWHPSLFICGTAVQICVIRVSNLFHGGVAGTPG
jgi:hypothetical protein